MLLGEDDLAGHELDALVWNRTLIHQMIILVIAPRDGQLDEAFDLSSAATSTTLRHAITCAFPAAATTCTQNHQRT